MTTIFFIVFISIYIVVPYAWSLVHGVIDEHFPTIFSVFDFVKAQFLRIPREKIGNHGTRFPNPIWRTRFLPCEALDRSSFCFCWFFPHSSAFYSTRLFPKYGTSIMINCEFLAWSSFGFFVFLLTFSYLSWVSYDCRITPWRRSSILGSPL